jgi:predicted ATPase with chaperone activity
MNHMRDEALPMVPPTDFREIKGQEHVKRALEIAAAGGHNVILLCTTDHALFHRRFGG